MGSIRYALIDAATGAIIRMGQCSEESLEYQAARGQLCLTEFPEGIGDDTHYRKNGAWAAYPPRPDAHHVFDFAAGNWLDPRTPQDIEAAEQDRLAAARASASLSRSDAVLAAVGIGILPECPIEAGAGRGEIPASLQQVFSSLPTEMQIEAAVRWGGATVIERLDPILLALAQSLGVTDRQLDVMFGITPAE